MRPSLAVLSLAMIGLALTPETSRAQGGQDPQAQAVQDQQVDLALGTLDTPSLLTQLKLPSEPGTRGPLPFDIEPPAAQNDFGDTTIVSCPRRGALGNC